MKKLNLNRETLCALAAEDVAGAGTILFFTVYRTCYCPILSANCTTLTTVQSIACTTDTSIINTSIQQQTIVR